MNLFSLWRLVDNEWELVRLSTDLDELRNLMSEDAKGCLLPLQYKLSIEHVSGDLRQEGRIDAYREAAEFFDNHADTFPTHTEQRLAFRNASVKLFAWMEQEIGK